MTRVYHRDSKGRFTRNPGGNGNGKIQSLIGGKIGRISKADAARIMFGSAAKPAASKPVRTKIGSGVIQNISTGKPISREEAARIMFGSGARKTTKQKRSKK